MVKSRQPSKEQVKEWLSEVTDPEIPVLNIVEMGIVREIHLREDEIRVDITPTYSGCPAMEAIEKAIGDRLRGRGIKQVEVRRVHATPWTTDWLTAEAREKLRSYGIAPPTPGDSEQTQCPFCGSSETELRSFFGSTACKSLHFCRSCRQPFEEFKRMAD